MQLRLPLHVRVPREITASSLNTFINRPYSYTSYIPTHTRRRIYSAMASATTFYDFKPLDSTSYRTPPSLPYLVVLPIHVPISTYLTYLTYPTSLPSTKPKLTREKKQKNRKRPTLPPLQPQEQSRPHRQHSLQMRLHPPVRRSRETIPESEIHPLYLPLLFLLIRGRLHHPRLPLQPIRVARSRRQRHDPILLPDQLRRFVPCTGQDGREWG